MFTATRLAFSLTVQLIVGQQTGYAAHNNFPAGAIRCVTGEVNTDHFVRITYAALHFQIFQILILKHYGCAFCSSFTWITVSDNQALDDLAQILQTEFTPL